MTEPKQKRTFEVQAVPALNLVSQQKCDERCDKNHRLPNLFEMSDKEQTELLDKLINRVKKI